MEKFFADKAKHSAQKSASERKEEDGKEEVQGRGKATFPKGVVLGKDGKPYLSLFNPTPLLLLPFQFVQMAKACICVCVCVSGGKMGKKPE